MDISFPPTGVVTPSPAPATGSKVEIRRRVSACVDRMGRLIPSTAGFAAVAMVLMAGRPTVEYPSQSWTLRPPGVLRLPGVRVPPGALRLPGVLRPV